MLEFKKPKIGLLGMMLGGYEPLFPGIIERQENFAREVASSVSDMAEVVFPGAATDRESAENIVAQFNNDKLDGILIVMLAYGNSTWIMHAMQSNALPVGLAVLQPDDVMKTDFEELDFTVNQGIHGAQDNANGLNRMGIACQYFAGSRHGDRFKKFFSDFSKAAAIYTRLRSMRVATFGKMTGMGDLFADEIALYKNVGPEYCHETIGYIAQLMEKVSEADINKRMEYEKTIFDIDPQLKYEDYAHAIRQYLAIKMMMEERDYSAFTIHFDVLGDDGRFRQLPFLAASNLMAEGYGFAAEGDAMCATALSIALQMTDRMATFSEMYAMDFDEQAVLMCHAGESNWRIAKKSKKPRLVDKVFNEGGLENPPTPIFTPEPGRATVVSFAPMLGEKFKFVMAEGEILAKDDLRGCEMPYMFFKPDAGMENFVEKWLEAGGTHHEVVTIGDTVSCWKMLAKMMNVEAVLID